MGPGITDAPSCGASPRISAPGAFPLLLSGSARAQGNSDTVLTRIQTALWARTRENTARACAGTGTPPVVAIREYRITPCIACGMCDARPGFCPLAARDGCEGLFAMLDAAPALVLAAPIYFYHLPASVKGLMDRSQVRWALRFLHKAPPPPRKKAYIVLVAARPRGDKLFEGSLLSCKYWLDLFGYDLADPLTLYGLDGPRDLAANAAACARVDAYAATIGADLWGV